MPAIKSGSKVLVTGASGFIAVWLIKTLLEQGFKVRGTVRTASKGEYLVKLFGKNADFEYIIVKNIEEEGAFDQAVRDVDGVAHTASPFHLKAEDPNDLIEPAVKGTVGILDSVIKYGPSVQRVVILSSRAAIGQPPEGQRILTEKQWNESAIKEVETKGRNAAPGRMYQASKTLAEKAAWDFVAKHKANIQWDIVALNPPFVWGPTLHEITNAAALNTSIAEIYDKIKGRTPITAVSNSFWVDVRDVSEAHVKALTVAQAGGERFLLSSGAFTWQDFIDAVHSDPTLVSLPTGNPGAGKNVTPPVLLDTTKARTVLGLKFKEIQETAIDSVKSLLEREKEWGDGKH